MDSLGNICVIGSEKMFALDIKKKFIETALEKGYSCIFLGEDDFLEIVNIQEKEKVICFNHCDFKIDDLEKRCEKNKIWMVVSSNWILKYAEKLEKGIEDVIKIMQNSRYKILTCFNIIDFEIEEIEKSLLLFDEIIFDDKNKRQTIHREEISNIQFLLKSIQKAKLDKMDLEKNKKNLQILNDSIIGFSFENNLDELIKKSLETALNITHADYGSITILFNQKKIEKEYSYSNIDLTNSYRIYSNEEIVGIITLGYKEKFYKKTSDDYIIDIICKSLGDIIYRFKEKEEGQILKNDNNKVRFIGEVAGGIVHDLNNIFAIVKGYTQLLGINKEAKNIKEYIEIISSVTNEGIEKIKTIQDFSRNIKENKKYISINDIIVKAVKTTRPKWENMSHIKGRNIHIITELDSHKSVYIKAHEIRESIINMILNAVDAMIHGGNIYIKTYDEENFVVVEVMDEGMGIEDEILESIFDPFFTTKEKSTGLGLSIVKKNIESNEGEIAVESIQGKMTKFKIKLPIREENVACYV